MLPIDQIRQDFPILNRTNKSGKKLIYLDNAATTQKPIQVIDAINDFYMNHNSNIHRGIHFLGVEATELYEDTRNKVRDFIGADYKEEIVFVRGTTEGINLVASSFAEQIVSKGDRLLITGMEHHSNLIPWQRLALSKKAHLDIISVSDFGEIDVNEVSTKITNQTKLLAISHISNSLGTINPIAEVIKIAHDKGIPVLIDGAQAVGHQPVNMNSLNCDFYTFSGHKMFGPTGIGVLYAKKEYLSQMDPYQFGGEMIKTVSYEDTSFADLPHRFEAGTPDIAGVVGLGAAINYLNSIGLEKIRGYTEDLAIYMADKLCTIEGLKIIGNPTLRGSIVSFVFDHIHPHDVATILDEEGIAIRAGHHCAMPLMHSFNISGTSRASVAFYNDRKEIDQLYEALLSVKTIFA